MPSSQITVRARDCLDRVGRPHLIGDLLVYRSQDWVVVGLFMGADPITTEIEEYLVLEGRPVEDRGDRGVGERGDGRMDPSRRPRLRSSGAILVAVVAALSLLSGPVGGPVLAQGMHQPQGTQQVQQSQGIPRAQQEYLLGPGDTIAVAVLGDSDLTRTVIIRPDGKINMPLIGDVVAAGQTSVQLSERLATALKVYLRNPQVSVSVTGFHVEKVYVFLVGQVTRTGPVEIEKGWTVMEVMAVAGGVTSRAALRRGTIIRRSTGEAIRLDLERLLLRADRSANMAVEPGDIIIVPALQNRIIVLGLVSKPGTYDLDDGASVLDAIALAGGPEARAQRNNIGVIRRGADGKPTVIRVDMNKIVSGELSQNIAVQDADVIYVPEGAIVRWTDILTWLSGLGLIRSLFGL